MQTQTPNMKTNTRHPHATAHVRPCKAHPSFGTKVVAVSGGPRVDLRWRHEKRYRAATLSTDMPEAHQLDSSLNFHGVHHVGLLCKSLETSLAFYQDIIELEINPDRPHNKLPYRGAWLWIGSEMIHLMELPDPDPKDGRPEHGGRDRHFCVGIENLDPLVAKLKRAGVRFTESMSGRRAVFFRDPDMNCLEVFESKVWRDAC